MVSLVFVWPLLVLRKKKEAKRIVERESVAGTMEFHSSLVPLNRETIRTWRFAGCHLTGGASIKLPVLLHSGNTFTLHWGDLKASRIKFRREFYILGNEHWQRSVIRYRSREIFCNQDREWALTEKQENCLSLGCNHRQVSVRLCAWQDNVSARLINVINVKVKQLKGQSSTHKDRNASSIIGIDIVIGQTYPWFLEGQYLSFSQMSLL